MRLIVLGSAGYHPNRRRHTLCLLLPECGVMFDAGTAVFCAGEYLAAPELDIFLSHAHIDHIVGLTYLLSVRQAHPLRRITVHGSVGTLKAVEEHLFARPLFPTRPPFECRPLADVCDLAGGGRLTHFPLAHRGESIGYRIDWPGRSMAFVTDALADADAAYVGEIRGVDLLVHECYFDDDRAQLAAKTMHGHATSVAQVARRAGVGRLALVHFDPLSEADDPVGLATVQAIFPNAILCDDGVELEF
jgi:ribonuclease Z